jgi:hypothetical protein
MGIETIAEFVEDRQLIEWLTAVGAIVHKVMASKNLQPL